MSTGGTRRPFRARTVLPALTGRGVLLAAPQDAQRITEALSAAGFRVVDSDLRGGEERPADTLAGDPPRTSLRIAQAAVATALRLPDTAGRNLDALVDSLRDLAIWWPDDERIVLLLHGADSLVDTDLPGWHTLTEILREASSDLWRGGVDGDREFETVAFVHQHGVPTLPAQESPGWPT